MCLEWKREASADEEKEPVKVSNSNFALRIFQHREESEAVAFVGGAAEVGGLDEHACIAAGFGFLNGEVEGLFELLEMGAEISVGKLEHLFEGGEVDRASGLKRTQGGHDPETNRLVDKRVEFLHELSLA